MAALLSSKIVVVEEEPRVRGIAGMATSVAGVIGVTERGPVGEAVCCTSLESFGKIFGGVSRDTSASLAAQCFFENGGSTLWVVRAAHFTDPADRATCTAACSSGELVAAEDPVLKVVGKTPGTYADALAVEVREPANGEPDAFDLNVSKDGAARERFSNVSLDPGHERFVCSVVNSPSSGSDLIRVELMSDAAPVPDIQSIALSGGDDGLTGLCDQDFIGAEAGRTGIHGLDAVQGLTLLLVPGRSGLAVHGAMLSWCENRNAFAILDPPEGRSARGMADYMSTEAGLYNLSEYGAIYWPWVKILNPSPAAFGNVETVTVPPSGAVAGVFSRTADARPGGVYDPPAGVDKGVLKGVLGFETDEVLQEKARDLVYPKRVNPLTTGPEMPRFIDGSRTLKGNGNFPYVAERLGVSHIERSLRNGLQFARHKNNTEGLRAQVRRTVTAFLQAQMRCGAFRSDEASKAFFVDVSEELNTPTVVDSGQLVVRIGLATNKPAEFIVLRISQDTRAIEAELAGA